LLSRGDFKYWYLLFQFLSFVKVMVFNTDIYDSNSPKRSKTTQSRISLAGSTPSKVTK